MKKITYVLGMMTVFAMTSITFTSCGDEAKHEEHAHKHYKCPMECEGDTVHEEPGECSVCHMALAEME